MQIAWEVMYGTANAAGKQGVALNVSEGALVAC